MGKSEVIYESRAMWEAICNYNLQPTVIILFNYVQQKEKAYQVYGNVFMYGMECIYI